MDSQKVLEFALEVMKQSNSPAVDSKEEKPPKYRLQVGGKYCFRTVTMIYTGEIVEIQGDLLVLKNAAWIPETNRWNESIKTGIFKEVEPYPENEPVFVFKGALLDVCAIPQLPREVK